MESDHAAPGAPVPAGGREPRVEWWLALGLAVVGGVLVAVTTRHGARLTSDSVAYLSMGRRISDDPLKFFGPGTDPVVDKLNHWSPLAGLALAWTSWLDSDPFTRARYLGIASGAACTALVFVLVRRRACRTAAILTALLLLCSYELVWTLGTLGSETEFFPLVLLLLVAADVAIGGDRLRPGWLVVASLAGALSVSARFIGVSGLAALLVCAWFLCRREDRGRAFGIVVVAGLVPAGIWTLVYGSDRTPGMHLPTDQATELMATFARWVVPLDLPAPLRALVALVVVAAVAAAVVLWIRACRRTGLVGHDRLLFLLAVMAAAYTAMLLFSSTFLDPDIAYRARILYPLLAAFVVGVAVEAGRPERVGERAVLPPTWRTAATVVAIVLLVASGASTIGEAFDGTTDDGYERPIYTESETVAAAAELPEGTLIYSNAKIPLSLYAGRVARSYPWAPGAGAPTEDDLAPMLDDLRAGDGVIVFLDPETVVRNDLPARADLEALPSIEVVATFDDGAILRVT